MEQTQASLAEAKAKGVEQEMMCHHLGAELSRMEAALANADASKTQIEAQATRIAIARDRMATRLAETQAEVNVRSVRMHRLVLRRARGWSWPRCRVSRPATMWLGLGP